MYLKYYGLSKKPFSLIPDPEFMHFSQKHKLAYNLLEYGIYEQTGLTVITGEIGSGKTTLLRYLLQKIDYQKISVGLIDNTHESWGELPKWITSAFDIALDNNGSEDKATLYKEIKRFIIHQYSQGRRVLLIVDEAQNLSEQTLEELRLLMNINSGNDFLLQIVLVGQPELLVTLQKPTLTQFVQRISVEYHLTPLSLEETHSYINHRLKIAQCHGQIFDSLAIEQIFKYSDGTPRLINMLCDNALVCGYALNRDVIGEDVILDFVSSRKLFPGKNTKTIEPIKC